MIAFTLSVRAFCFLELMKRRKAIAHSQTCLYLNQEESACPYSGTKLYRTAAAYLKEELPPQKPKVASASSKFSSSSSILETSRLASAPHKKKPVALVPRASDARIESFLAR
jgi:hypothetical protein